MRWSLFYLTIFYLVTFCCNFLEACSFLTADREGVDEDGRGAGEKLGGGEGGKL